MEGAHNTPFTISIGIPAFNEEANIGYLLHDLLRQKEEGYSLEKIFVYSDGSTDATEEIVRSIQDERIELIVGPGRKGQAEGQNTMMQQATSEALVLLNADIQVKDEHFLAKIVHPLQNGKDLVSVKHQAVQSRNFFESVLATGLRLKDILFESYRKGENVYTCHGGARALSKRLYQEMSFAKSVGEDAYSYFFCLSRGYAYQYLNTTSVFYRLPDNFSDHQKQSKRFFKGRYNFGDIFGSEVIRKEMHIPYSCYLSAAYRALPFIMTRPIQTLVYGGIVLWLRTMSFFGQEVPETWEIAMSSKKLQ